VTRYWTECNYYGQRYEQATYSRTKTIEVRKVKPVTCTLCDTAAEFYINYRDPANPGQFHETNRVGNHSTGYTDPTIGYRACAAHVVDVTYLATYRC
jgi:hypothetical protein